MNKKLLAAAIIACVSVSAFAKPHYEKHERHENREAYAHHDNGRHEGEYRGHERAESRRFDEARKQPRNDTFHTDLNNPNNRVQFTH
ncbi:MULTISPECIES: hypothetical protein [Caballeronia]|uniref:hypothetical protein n=1 Tax=Caballeronia TaxID=1827195 RepID=UPI0002EAAB95|nr:MULTISPECIES: hypothetical protein [unclassified Caballeronia]AQH01288.1 hypothetical protein A9R05_20845 [Burkholderia sp. KK1]BAO89168.1 hypothetical protein BRPE67_BCDS12540 [Burkholderia sp. RPE67]BBP98270.1 hypothetical protein BSFA1_33990 [Burkholderia sp. SFA1]MCE4545009.1 hypothetical protein [Caballeronia sp. PC1]MCE4570433.1 hypothetical protein [Caballeronia sp. CLC5]